MVKNLNEKQHISASIYCNNEDKEFYLHSRCKIKNLDYRSLEMCVFCLKFYFYFGSNILACCLIESFAICGWVHALGALF